MDRRVSASEDGVVIASGSILGMRDVPAAVFQHMRSKLLAQGYRNVSEAKVTTALIALAVDIVSADLAHQRRGDMLRRDITALMERRQPAIVFQPIFARDGSIVEIEALSRFDSVPYRSPDLWFAEADDAGLGIDVELAAIGNALSAFDEMQARTAARLAVNASATLVMSGQLMPLLARTDPSRLVLELTEQRAVPCYDGLNAHLAPLRQRGVRIAVDDMGAGAAGVQHLLGIRPDILKADRTMVQGLDQDPMKRAMMQATVAFAHDLAIKVTAEGVETTGEYDILHSIGVDAMQGYLLGKPMTPADLIQQFGLAV